MRTRIGSTIAVVVATVGIAAGVAGPIYSAFGDSAPAASTVQASAKGKIMR